MTSLDQLHVGQRAFIVSIDGTGAVVQRLYEMGLLEDEPVEVVSFAPLGDPMEIRVRDFCLSLRRKEAAHVQVDFLPSTNTASEQFRVADKSGNPASSEHIRERTSSDKDSGQNHSQ